MVIHFAFFSFKQSSKMNKSKVKSDLGSKSKEHLVKGSKIPKIPKSDVKAGFKSHSVKNDYSSSSAAVTSKLIKSSKCSNISVSKVKLIPDLFKKTLDQNSEKCNQTVKSKSSFNSKLPALDSKLKLTKALKSSNSTNDGHIYDCKKTRDKKMQEQVARVSPIKRTSLGFEIKSDDCDTKLVKVSHKCNLDLINNNQIKQADKTAVTFKNNRIYNGSNLWKHTQRSSIGHLMDKYSYSDSECGEKVNKIPQPIQNKCQVIRPDNNRGSASQVNLLLESLNKRNKSSFQPCPNLKLVNLIDNSSNQV